MYIYTHTCTYRYAYDIGAYIHILYPPTCMHTSTQGTHLCIHIFMCIYVFLQHTHICIYIHIYIPCIHTHICGQVQFMHSYMYPLTHIRIQKNGHEHAATHMCVISTCVNMCIYICIYTYTYIYMDIPKHVHMYMSIDQYKCTIYVYI